MKEFINAFLKLDIGTLFKNKTTNSYIQFFRYIFVGGVAFFVDALSLWACEKIMDYLFAAAIAFVLGLAVNYIISVKFVFSESEQVSSKLKEFVIYAVIGIVGLLLTELILYALTEWMHIYFMISKIVAAAIVLLWNFIARKKIIYKNH